MPSSLNIKLQHIGYLVNSIDKALKQFSILGFTFCSRCMDTSRGVEIALIKNSDDVCIELIQPADKDNPVQNILKKVGPTPYHLCFSVNTSEQDISRTLLDNGFKVISKYSKAPDLGECTFVKFFYSSSIGIIEVVFTE